ncbi:paraneoplastic antigen Ma1 homolog [Mauremys mutica]|uniref:paraneoplastic antigen Ma1 homolog n=1 Tax=Mauremys mutica TaxID=74926 RepID=UPI001D16162C|nr:paraneoplastic antigen Ma1 homolog [Mauremys mutica]
MALLLLEDWCKGMNIDPRNCLLVTGVLEAVDEGSIEPTLRSSTEYLRKRKMRGRMFVREEGAFAVLCELPSAVDPLQVPGSIAVEDGEWKVITTGSQPSPAPTPDVEFLKKMSAFLGKEGKTLADMAGLLGLKPEAPQQEPAPSPDEWVKALGRALEKVMPPHPESSPYRKLRLFSGGPTPIPGEEAFEPWLEHTTEMLQEWAVPDTEKRRRLVECLRGAALDVIRTLKLGNPGVKVKDCLEALDHAFGRTEGSEDAYCKFFNARQQKGEKGSAYIQRLEKLLQRAIMRGAVAVEQMDRTRLAQVVRGIQYQNPILLHLRLRERQDNPPSYSRLIKEVRGEEERQAAGEVWEVQQHQATGTTSMRTPKALIVNPQEELIQQVQALTQKVTELENTFDSAKTLRCKEPSGTMVQRTTFRTSASPVSKGKDNPSSATGVARVGTLLQGVRMQRIPCWYIKS